MTAIHAQKGLLGAMTALALIACATDAGAARRRPGAPSLSAIGSFTPAAADPRRAATFAIGGLSDSAFRFTPSGTTGKPRRVTVAVRARAVVPTRSVTLASTGPAATISNLAPSAYSLGASIGWKRFALSGDILQVQGNLLPMDREAVDLGVSFSGRRWATKVELGADRPLGDRPQILGIDRSYSVDLGGSYALARNLEVTGGVRYKLQRDRSDPLADERRDSQAIYVGTAFRF